jgi:hypothetical protein
VRRLLGDPSWVVRSHAAKAAGASRQASLAPQLAALLEDRSWWVRQNATLALAELGVAAVPALLEKLRSSDRFARNKAAEALIRSGYVTQQIELVNAGGPDGRKAWEFLVDLGRAEAVSTIENSARTAPAPGRDRLRAALRAIGIEHPDVVPAEMEPAGGECGG